MQSNGNRLPPYLSPEHGGKTRDGTTNSGEGKAQDSPFRALPPERQRLADRVYRQVLDAIVGGFLPPGGRIIQERLAAEINVSRTPVREALLQLEREGILARSGSGGFKVRSITDKEVSEVYETREAIEGHAARMVAERRDASALDRIAAVVEAEESLSGGGVEAYFHANRRIHRSVLESAGNEMLLRLFDRLWNRGASLHIFAAIDPGDLAATLSGHETLVAAMRTKSPAEAGEAMVMHIRNGLALQLRSLAEMRRD